MKQRLKKILSIALTLSLIWGIVGIIAPVRSYADDVITVDGTPAGEVHIFSNTAYGSASDSTGAVIVCEANSQTPCILSWSVMQGLATMTDYSGFDSTTNGYTHYKCWIYCGDRVAAGTYNGYIEYRNLDHSDIYRRDYSVVVVDKHTITFDANGGTCDTATAETNEYEQLASLPTPTNGDRTFLGWYTATENGTQVNANSTTFNGNATIYALWSETGGDDIGGNEPQQSQPQAIEAAAEPQYEPEPVYVQPVAAQSQEPSVQEDNAETDNAEIDNGPKAIAYAQLLALYSKLSQKSAMYSNYTGNISLDMGKCVSFDKEFYRMMDTIISNGGSVTINYIFKGRNISYTIPAHLPIKLEELCDKDGYLGFENLRGILIAKGYISPTQEDIAILVDSLNRGRLVTNTMAGADLSVLMSAPTNTYKANSKAKGASATSDSGAIANADPSSATIGSASDSSALPGNASLSAAGATADNSVAGMQPATSISSDTGSNPIPNFVIAPANIREWNESTEKVISDGIQTAMASNTDFKIFVTSDGKTLALTIKAENLEDWRHILSMLKYEVDKMVREKKDMTI